LISLRPSPTKPSSPSKTHDCSKRCRRRTERSQRPTSSSPRRWISRRRRARFCASSQAPRPMSNRCSTPSLKRP
jgi:hypothetical protein